MSIDPSRVQAVFLVAVESKDPAERVEVLNAHCAGDAELRARVEELLQAYDRSSELPGVGLEDVAPGSRATVIQSAATPAGRVIAGRYRLLEEIGEGGMGTVWVAEQTQPVRRRVALKLIKPGMDSRQVLSRFEAERQALAVMDHPNIAKVLDGGVTDEGRPYFVMEYVKGMPITEFCDHAKVTVAGRLNLFVQICQAVQHAHQKGIIHRDLKPSNILVCLYDGQPVPKVIDFGLAKAIHQPLMEHTLYTAHGVMVGTPMQDLASSYYSVGRYAEALKLYEETLALQKAKFGLSNVDTLRCMRNLALTYMPSAGTLRPLSCARRRWRSTRPSSALTTPIRSGA